MMKFLPMLAGAVATMSSAAVQAQIPRPSVSASLGYTKKEDSNIEAVQARLTGRFHRNFGVEAEGALGIEPHTLRFSSVPPLTIKNQLRGELGVYGVGYLPLGPDAELFARIGYGNTWLKRTFAQAPNTAAVKLDSGSFNYGVGGQYFLDGKNGVRIDYTRQDFSKDIPTEDTWAVSYTRRF